MTEVRLDYDEKLREIISKWEDSLEANYDDYEYVDGEEGDYGIIRYYGIDEYGNANVHLMTKYVHGGDHERSLYTMEGANMVQRIIQQNLEKALRESLEASLDPGESEGMFHGWKAHTEEAARLIEKQGRRFVTNIFPGYDGHGMPKEMENGAVYRFGYKYYVCVVHPKKPDREQTMYFYNIVNPAERLMIELTMEGNANRGLFCTHHANWRQALGQRKIKPWVVADDDALPSRSPALRILL